MGGKDIFHFPFSMNLSCCLQFFALVHDYLSKKNNKLEREILFFIIITEYYFLNSLVSLSSLNQVVLAGPRAWENL